MARRGPGGHKAPFSPGDVIEEYLRPARVVAGGQMETRAALSDLCTIEFSPVGQLEAFTTDGLRSLVDTLDVPDMIEQTLRYPGYRDQILLLRESGLFDETPVLIDGVPVRPRDLTCAKLFELWRYELGEADLTVMRVEAEGDLDGAAVKLRWDLHDRYDPQTGFSSMARTTGFPATIVARAIESGMISHPGVHPPEALVGVPGLIDHLMDQLQLRGVHYEMCVQT
ncbi:MAG: hypothetical protein MK101_11125 [Phycisphaerales bacterium]|nr:hypothetical protein [Phycisphaerales bacterium]